MKVLLVHNFHRAFKPSGEDVAYRRERDLLRASGRMDVHTYERSTDETAAYGPLDKLRLAVRLPFDEAVHDDLRARLRRLRPDVVHVHNTFPLLTSSVFAACQAEGVPVVLTLHNHYLFCARGTLDRGGRPCTLCLTTRNPWHGVRYGCYGDSRAASVPVVRMIRHNWLEGFWARNVDGFIALTPEGRARFIEAGLPPEKLHVKPHFLPDPDLDPAIAVAPSANAAGPPPRTAALFIGRLTTEKGIETLLDAAHRLHSAGTAVPIRIVGGGPDLDRYRAQVASLPGVALLGAQPQDACLRLAREALCVVVPSICPETFGLTVIEAFASRTPVVASRLGSLPELVEDGRTGLTFPPGDAVALAEAISLLAREPGRASALGATARATYETLYTPDNNIEQLLRIYERVVEARSAARLPDGGTI